jgi:hypothetical protein
MAGFKTLLSMVQLANFKVQLGLETELIRLALQ